ncbi:nostrin isoform X2 [Periophthalmus magnuspinnatus]|uniref:nostrin isoform X2 n=1 Tax=Periophthalmus magnuspinnatus TaxID=409849 RepID=UPI00145BDC8B|nr:nostrin isoform X2 [Periophthalmus magnuspinnatus]
MHWRMKEHTPSSQYNQLYQDVKRFSKSGEYFCKELTAVFHQRSELELTYSKGLQKLAGKLIRASKEMTNNSTYSAWCHVSDEMYSRADAHRSLGNAFQQEATVELKQVLDEHNKRKRPLDNAIERSGKAVTANWTDQLKLKKKLIGLTREHEALFNFVENNKHMSTEKEKQKMLNRLTKSAELQARVDDEYFNMNLEGYETRLKWENTLKACYQIIQEMEKQRIEVLGEALNRYNLHMSSFGQALKHGQKQIEQTVQRVDVDRDIDTLLAEHRLPPEDNKAEFLMVDYFEEDNKSLMGKERRREALQIKVQRLQDNIAKTKKDIDGIKRLIKTYSENPSFSNERNIEETEQQLDETTLKLDLLEATHYKLSLALSEVEGRPKSLHRFTDSISKWKDKDSEHSVVHLRRPVKLRRSSYRSRRSLRASIIYKGPHPIGPQQSVAPSRATSPPPTQETGAAEGDKPHTEREHKHAEQSLKSCSIGLCKAIYDFTPKQEDELSFKEGDVLNIYTKEENGWWFGELNGHKGHFPCTYVVEVSMEKTVKMSEEVLQNNTQSS